MRIGTAQMLHSIDKACEEKLGIPMVVLMENAAIKVVKHLNTENNNKYVIVCGRGNNGGDGFAVARHLIALNKAVEVFVIKSESKMSDCTATNYEILKKLNAKLTEIASEEDLEVLIEALKTSDMSIDAILGTGLNKKLQGMYDKVIKAVNENSKNIISIDIPSGLHCDTGEILGNCVKAHKTISFELYKRGFLNYSCYDVIGEVIVEKIGVPDVIIEEFHNKEFIINSAFIRENIKIRGRHQHKGDFGRVSIIAGSKGFYGAAFISTQAAVRTGTGLVTLISDEEVQNILALRLTEAMTANFNSVNYDKLIQNCDSIAFGPGLGNNNVTLELLRELLKLARSPIVIDADGINVLANNLDLLLNKSNQIVLTPHLAEMSRLTGLSLEYIKNNRVDVAKNFAAKYGVVLLLKGYETIITDGNYTYINPTGNSAMASGGMGDCLTGIIASLIGQGIKPLEAACCGAYIHGYIGDELSLERHSVIASDVLERIPFVLKKYEYKKD